MPGASTPKTRADLLVRGGTIVDETGERRADVLV